MKALTDLSVVILDCQATYANPARGHLLEIAWAMVKASDTRELGASEVRTFLLEVPKREIPSHVSRVTGITPDDLKQALAPARVWKLLEEDIESVAPGNQVTAIIHFARFERPHLEHLSLKVRGTKTLPFQILCTHEISRLLLPQLPRKGLRAVAGYFGHSIPEMRRSVHHVLATAFIWKHIVQLLDQDLSIRTIDDLTVWLQSANVKKTECREYPMNPNERLSLPDSPGVYRMLRSNGDLLYVGKASSLKRRVNSYFQKRSHRAEHILEMLTQARSLDFSVTPTSLEAALLEAEEIKNLAPPYNIALRKKDRDLVFTSRDFRNLVRIPSRSHCVGPLPRGVAGPLSLIVTLADRGGDTAKEGWDKCQILSPAGDSTDSTCVQMGWSLFKECYAAELSNPSRCLFQLGARLWMRRQVEVESTDTDSDGSERMSWTPERVFHLLENRVMIAVHWARRVRWFGLLSNSSIAWTPRRDASQNQVLLVLQSGGLIHRETLRANTKIPVPPGYKTSSLERLEQFDAVVLDRLRVLTTELRRLVGQGSDLRVRFSPTLTLETTRLAKILQWV